MADAAALGHALGQRGIAGRAVYILQSVSTRRRWLGRRPLTAE
jgi:hypothetical protein